jgi:hypothetical protein
MRGMTAMFMGVPMAPIIRKMSSTLSSLFVAFTALGTVYWLSSTIKSILRPWMPPAALASSKRMRCPLVAGTPQIARLPERSVCDPIVIESAVTPRGSPSDVPSSAPPQPASTNIAATSTIAIFFIAGPINPFLVTVHTINQFTVFVAHKAL